MFPLTASIRLFVVGHTCNMREREKKGTEEGGKGGKGGGEETKQSMEVKGYMHQAP